MQRRAFLVTSAFGCVLAWPHGAQALSSEWWPYAANASVRIDPELTQPAAASAGSGYVKKMPRVTQPVINGRGSKLLPPKAYDVTGRRYNVDPWLLYGVALQESLMKFGEHTLPYPWTLCVAGAGKRYGSYESTLDALRHYVERKDIRNVDCGAMQVNWRWHSDKLKTFERALDPYLNLAVGAQILREHYERQRSWGRAVALYHTGTGGDAATAARGQRYSSRIFKRLARMGVDSSALLQSTGWRRYVG